MVSFNRVILAGNLTRDPELDTKQINGEDVDLCNFGLAVNRPRSKDEAVDFFDVTVWRAQAKSVADYKSKGDPVLVEGRLQYRSWEDNDGNKRSKVDVVADNVQFLGRGNGDGGGGGGKKPSVSEEDFDDIPF